MDSESNCCENCCEIHGFFTKEPFPQRIAGKKGEERKVKERLEHGAHLAWWDGCCGYYHHAIYEKDEKREAYNISVSAKNIRDEAALVFRSLAASYGLTGHQNIGLDGEGEERNQASTSESEERNQPSTSDGGRQASKQEDPWIQVAKSAKFILDKIQKIQQQAKEIEKPYGQIQAVTYEIQGLVGEMCGIAGEIHEKAAREDIKLHHVKGKNIGMQVTAGSILGIVGSIQQRASDIMRLADDHETEGDITVIHGFGSAGEVLTCHCPDVREESAFLNQSCRRTFIMDYSGLHDNNGEDTVKNMRSIARSKHNERKRGQSWNLSTSNCEHTAYWAKTHKIDIEPRNEISEMGKESSPESATHSHTTTGMNMTESPHFQSSQVNGIKSFCCQLLIVLVLKVLVRSGAILMTDYIFERAEKSSIHPICDSTAVYDWKNRYELLTAIGILAIELVYFVIDARFCCGGEFCCCCCQEFCKSRTCCGCQGGTTSPFKWKKLILAFIITSSTVAIPIIFEVQFGKTCGFDRLKYSFIGTIVGLLVGTIAGHFIANTVAFWIEVCCMKQNKELEEKKENNDADAQTAI